jgi:hypothetical protein
MIMVINCRDIKSFMPPQIIGVSSNWKHVVVWWECICNHFLIIELINTLAKVDYLKRIFFCNF